MERQSSWLEQAYVTIVRLPSQTIAGFESLPRPAQLLSTVALVAGLSLAVDAMNCWRVWNQLFHPDISTPADVRFWSALVYALAFAMGLPIAFLVWHWRDRNVRDQIEEQRKSVENSRKDINLKEFQEVQARAAGLFDEKMPESARQQLQIAALHQLRAFLRSEYGMSFQRPAFELLLSGHAEAMGKIGTRQIVEQIIKSPTLTNRRDIQQIVEKLRSRFDSVTQERIGIIGEEIETIFSMEFPLNGRNFDFISFKRAGLKSEICSKGTSFFGSDFSDTFFSNSDFSESVFIGSMFSRANLDNSNLSSAIFIGSHINRTSLKGANLSNSDLKYANLLNSSMQGAILSKSILSNATLQGANLEAANLSNVDAKSCDFRQTNFDEADFSYAYIDDADFTDSSLNRANLEQTSASRVKMPGCSLVKAKLEGIRLVNANLRDTNLRDADLTSADLDGANFGGAKLVGALLASATMYGANFSNADPEGVNMNGAQFDDRTLPFRSPTPYFGDDFRSGQDRLRALGARHINDIG